MVAIVARAARYPINQIADAIVAVIFLTSGLTASDYIDIGAIYAGFSFLVK